MNTKKMLAVFAVLCMVSTALVCVACTEVSVAAKPIVSDETVKLDADKDFDSNSEELAKLGITSSRYWTFDKEQKMYRLVLDNVNFETSSNIGLLITSTASKPGLIIELRGDNSIVSGSEDDSGFEAEKQYSSAIYAIHTDRKQTTVYNDFTLAIVGEGTITTDNDVSSDTIMGAAGIVVYGTLYLDEGATVYANAGDVNHVFKGTGAVTPENIDMYSSGVYVDALVMRSAEKTKTQLIATGGDINVKFAGATTVSGKIAIHSEGVSSDIYDIKDGYICAKAGDVTLDNTDGYAIGCRFFIFSAGVGEVILNQTSVTTKSVTVDKSKIVGYAGDITGNFANVAYNGIYAFSYGVGFTASDDENVSLDNCIVVGYGGNISCSNNANTTRSLGIQFDGNTELNTSLISGESGKKIIPKTQSSMGGISMTGLTTIDDSIINAHASTGASVSRGLFASKSMTISDSEIFTSGEMAVALSSLVLKSKNFVECGGYKNDKWVDIADPTIAGALDGFTEFDLMFRYDVVFYNKEYGAIGFERVDRETYVIPEYDGYVPSGMKFAGWENERGKPLEIGEKVTFDRVLFITAIFEEKGSSGGFDLDHNALIAIVIGAGAALGALALFFVAADRRRRD